MHWLCAVAAAATLLLAVPSPDTVVTEPRSGVALAAKVDDMCLLGIALRTKSFLKFKVYALGLYVSESALSGPLAVHRGKLDTSAFYRDLVVGDFQKQFVLKLVRDLSAEQIQGSFRGRLAAADPKLTEQFVAYFEATRAGQDAVLRYVPGVGLESTVAGVAKPTIADKKFADEVFAIWLRDRPSEEGFRRQLVSRASELIP
jgi:hypothetical protein